MRPTDIYIRQALNHHIKKIGVALGEDVDTLSIFSGIILDLDAVVKNAIEMSQEKKQKIAIILQTGGGIVEIVERIVDVIRRFYDEVIIVVPDRAMSAGTVLALSADRIMMNYFSVLGPIDPQIFLRDGNLVPALSYIKQYERLSKKADSGSLNTAEYAMLQQLEVGELYRFERARELSVELLINWLSQYKFKDWKETETTKTVVTDDMKKVRAKEIADLLNDPEKWHSHDRGIGIYTLRHELKLKIEDYSDENEGHDPTLNQKINDYCSLLNDYMQRENIPNSVHNQWGFNRV